MSQINYEEKVDELHETWKTDVEKRVLQQFPEQIILFNELLKKPELCIPENNLHYTFDISTLVKEENNCKNSEGLFPNINQHLDSKLKERFETSNKYITDAFDIIKPYILELFKDCAFLRIWITLSLPTVEDGNNFGVSVLEYILDVINQAELSAKKYHDYIVSYYIRRTKLVTKTIKYPEVEDYHRAIEEWDQNRYWLITSSVKHLQNCYLTLHDAIIKNLDKIKMPRSSYIDNLY